MTDAYVDSEGNKYNKNWGNWVYHFNSSSLELNADCSSEDLRRALTTSKNKVPSAIIEGLVKLLEKSKRKIRLAS